jgi:circadian clock protein KaiC
VKAPEVQPGATRRISSGTVGLDEILGGGFPARRMYLLQGDPGVGKTTMALQFLLAGVGEGERCLYVTLSETKEELQAVAASHGWSLERLAVYEMSVGDEPANEDDENTLYVPAEVELGERVTALLAEVDRVRPTRIVLDSCSELRLLAQNQLRFRRQLLALKAQLVRRNCTILLIENPTSIGGDPLLQSLVHGVLVMEQLAPLYGAERRRLRVAKLREVQFRGGYHDLVIRRNGLEVFPRLVAADHHSPFEPSLLLSGLAELDAMLGGGIDRGTSTLLLGPAGSGKSALTDQYAVAAAERGEAVVMFTFDEGLQTLLRRTSSLGLSFERHLETGHISVQQVDPAELSPGEFAHVVRTTVERKQARLVVIDSLNGYLQSMPEENFLVVQLHELLSYLRQRGVSTLLVMAQHGFLGRMDGPIDVSYLADSVVLTRYFEAGGRVRKAISVVKKRTGSHEDSIRELTLSARGLAVGPPLADFQGVLSGVPRIHERESPASPRAARV